MAAENQFRQLSKNTVDARNQLRDSELVRFDNPAGSGIRVMFVGNSITLHGPKAEIGWHHDWGMAASGLQKDYVHLLMEKIRQTHPDAAFCVCQVSSWERNYKNGQEQYPLYEAARAFDADIIVMRFIENCSAQDWETERFIRQLDALLSYLNGSGKAEIVYTTGFWHHPGDPSIEECARRHGKQALRLGDLGEQEEMMAIGLFEHKGVAMHPGDRGMAAIAERIFAALQPLLAR